MAKTRSNVPRPKQPTPKELTDDLLGFLQRKFYPGNPKAYLQQRRHLLAWVVLWPASWLNAKGVSLTTERYRQIFMAVMMDAVVHGTEKVKFPPAYLKQVIQSHFRIHGEEIYGEAKSARALVENVLLIAGRPAQAQPDPIRDLAAARAILVATKPAKKTPPKAPLNDQLNLI